MYLGCKYRYDVVVMNALQPSVTPQPFISCRKYGHLTFFRAVARGPAYMRYRLKPSTLNLVHRGEGEHVRESSFWDWDNQSLLVGFYIGFWV